MHQNKEFMTTTNFKPKFNGQRFSIWVITKQLLYPSRSDQYFFPSHQTIFLQHYVEWTCMHVPCKGQEIKRKMRGRPHGQRMLSILTDWQYLSSNLLNVRWVYGRKVLVFRLTETNLFSLENILNLFPSSKLCVVPFRFFLPVWNSGHIWYVDFLSSSSF